MLKTSIAELNKRYRGTFRKLTQSEYKKYLNQLNKKGEKHE